MIKTIQYLAEADNSRVLVALDLKAAFQNVSRSAMLYSKPMRILPLSSPSGTPAPRSTGCTTMLPTPKSVPTAGWIRVVLCQRGFSAAVDPVLRSVLAELCTHYDSGAKLFAYLDDWYLCMKPQYLLQTIAVITAATRSVNLAPHSTKIQVWKGSCQDPTPPEFQDKVTLTLSCLGGHLQTHGDIEPQPCCCGGAGHHGENNTTLSEICHHPLPTSTPRDSMRRR